MLFPVLGLGWGPVFREQCQSLLCLLVRLLRVGFLLCRGPPLPVRPGWGDLHGSCPARGALTSVRPLGGSPARARPVLGDALPLLPAILKLFRRPLLPRLLLWEQLRREQSTPLPLEGLVVQ